VTGAPFSRYNYIGRDARVILEIGANDGSTTNEFLSNFPDVMVYAFEPDPRAIEKFKRNVPTSRALLSEIAIGATDGTAEFYASDGQHPAVFFPHGWDQSGSLHKPKTHWIFWPWVTFDRMITVPVARLDTWSKQHCPGPIDLVFADVQGAEGDLIAGGRETLARAKFFYTEFTDFEWYEGQPTLRAIQESLKDLGFRLAGIFGDNALFSK
jgi:FkbM family methyltransferase